MEVFITMCLDIQNGHSLPVTLDKPDLGMLLLFVCGFSAEPKMIIRPMSQGDRFAYRLICFLFPTGLIIAVWLAMI
jgi:hypothetical protein